MCAAILCSVSVTASAARDIGDFQDYFLAYSKQVYEEDLAGEVAEPDWLIGDVDFDGTVSAYDALFVLNYCMLDPDAFSFEHQDCNQPKQYYYGYIDEMYRRCIILDRETQQYEFAAQEVYYHIFYYNSAIMADVNNDNAFSSEDALLILQYVVGKRSDFPRTDYQWPREKLMFFVWPEDYTLSMYFRNRQATVWPPEE